MSKRPKTVVMRQLDAQSIPYEVSCQDTPTRGAEGAAQQRGIPICQVVKSLLVVMPGRKYCLALVTGDRKLSLHKLGTALGQKNLQLARRDDVAAVTGYEPGAVSPLGLRRRLAIIVDQAVLRQETVSISGGRHDVGIQLHPQDLVRATEGWVADITQ